jgi:hypothetical protein
LKKELLILWKIIPIACLIFFPPALSPAQETEAPPQGKRIAGEAPPTDDAHTVYIIRKISFDTSGRSLPFALMYNGKLKEGELITGRKNLEWYIHDRTQRLVNQRVLEDDVRIEYTLDEAGGDGRVPVDLLVITRDTWNIMVFPKPLYSTNDGFDLTLKGRDYNFFGTMNPLRVDLGYALNKDNESSFNFLVDTDIPFQALGFRWNINFDNELNYTFGDPLGYKNTAGIAMELPFKTTTFTFSLEHYINVNTANGKRRRDQFGRYFDGFYNDVEFSTTWKIPTGINVAGYGELTYQPKISENISYNPAGMDEYEWNELRRGPSTSLSQYFGFERIDWIGNFRKGLDVSFNNANSFNHNQNTWNNDYSLNAIGHFIVTDFLGMSTRTSFRQWFRNFPDKLAYDLGDSLRGIVDDRIEGTLMLSFNLEFPFRIFTARPSEWFKKSKMRIFNFEFYLSPFLDMGFVYLPDHLNNHETDQNLFGMYYSGGFEAIIFPEFMRSLYLRISAGIDLEEYIKKGHLPGPEIFIGLGHFF